MDKESIVDVLTADTDVFLPVGIQTMDGRY